MLCALRLSAHCHLRSVGNHPVQSPALPRRCKNRQCIFPEPFVWKTGQDGFEENRTKDAVLPLSFLSAAVLPAEPTAYCALAALDENCGQYIEKYAKEDENIKAQTAKAIIKDKEKEQSDTKEAALVRAVKKGLKEEASQAVKELLHQKDALDIINVCMIPALDIVGKGFETGSIFLPQLLMSAEAAKAAFEVIKDHLSQSGQVQEKKGKVILATVKGDIHDIGKNIVKVLLENYSYDVIDLGKDVPPEVIVEIAIREQVPVVGLSALMTTTVPSMEETIRQLKEKAPQVKIMVGGAVLTQEYADKIGADGYCKDAMASVKFAERIIAEA